MGQQYDDVKACLEANRGRPMQLHQIQRWVKRTTGRLHAETAISARVREIREDLELKHGETINHQEVGNGSRQHVYWLAKKDLFTAPRRGAVAAPA